MPEREKRHASDQVDPECRRVKEWTQEYLGNKWTSCVHVEEEGRKQTLVLEHPARAWPLRLCLRKDGRNFCLPQTSDVLPAWLWDVTFGQIGAAWRTFPPRTP